MCEQTSYRLVVPMVGILLLLAGACSGPEVNADRRHPSESESVHPAVVIFDGHHQGAAATDPLATLIVSADAYEQAGSPWDVLPLDQVDFNVSDVLVVQFGDGPGCEFTYGSMAIRGDVLVIHGVDDVGRCRASYETRLLALEITHGQEFAAVEVNGYTEPLTVSLLS